jgi:hypothetical protein
MNFNFFLQGLANVLLNPAKHWDTINNSNPSSRLVRNSFFLPVVLLVSASAFFGSLLFTNAELPLSYSIMVSIKCFIVILIAVYSTSYILGEITFPLDLGRNFKISFRLVVFMITPFLLCQILSRLFESVLFVNILGFYGLYIFWLGAEKMLNPPQYKKMPLLIATFITLTAIYIASDLLLTMIAGRLYRSFFA